MFRNLMERLKATPPWVWITIAIAAAGLVISFLIYRNSAPTADTSGQAGTAGGVNPGDTSGGYSPYGNNSSQYQPDYSTQSLLQQMVNLLQGLQPKPGTPAPSPSPSPSPSPAPSPTPRPLPPVGRVPGSGVPPTGVLQPRRSPPIMAPPTQPHPVPTPAPAPAPTRRPAATAVPARQQPDYVLGSVVHADTHTGTQPHPGAISITVPHPLQQRQMGF